MSKLDTVNVNTHILVNNAANVNKDSRKTHKPKNAILRVYAKPMVVMSIVMVMEVADSKVVLQSVPVLQVLRMMVLLNALNVLIQCLIIQNVKYDLSSSKIQP
jgi:hypothetical protein